MRKEYFLLLFILLSDSATASGEREYHEAFYGKVIKFAERNRFHLDNIPLEIRNRCYLAVIIRTSVVADGTPMQTEVIESSGVPRLDKYFQYVINQAAPFPKLDQYMSPGIEAITLESLFLLDVRYYDEARRSTGPCSEFQTRRLLGEYSI